MALSRLRLRLGLGFSLAFAGGLAMLAAVALGYLWRESRRRLDERLDALTNDVSVNLAIELAGEPIRSATDISTEVVGEWPRNGGSFVISDENLRVLAHNDDSARVVEILKSVRSGDRVHFETTLASGESYRTSALRYESKSGNGTIESPKPIFEIVAFSSTAGISEDTELLLAAMAVATPIILLLSLTGGYLLAGRALQPVTELTSAVATIAPDDLSHRLDVREPKDELGVLAAEFNDLLVRLNSAQMQNRKFLREAAHQIRTPLTLVLGEAALELATPDSPPEQMRGSLKRIGLAAERMRRRVDELFLLAEAQTGEAVLLTEEVELDQVVHRAVELMRPRAIALGRGIAVGSAEPISLKGNSALLNEALLEMLENAIRHGDASRTVMVSVASHPGKALLEVVSGGQAFALPARAENEGPDGLGLPIVRWVAEVHDGELRLVNHAGWNTLTMILPIDA